MRHLTKLLLAAILICLGTASFAQTPLTFTGTDFSGSSKTFTGWTCPSKTICGAAALTLYSAGSPVWWPGDSSNGAWVNIKASSLGNVEGSAVSVGLSTGSATMGSVLTAAPTGGSAYANGTFDFP